MLYIMKISKRIKNSKLFAILKKVKTFLDDDTSMWSFIANMAIAFIFIKFIVYPGLSLVFGTGYPVVAIISGSMEHDGSFDDWWNEDVSYKGLEYTQSEFYNSYNISKEEFLEYSFKNGMNTGDVLILRGVDPEDVEIGDPIVFIPQKQYTSAFSQPIVHRVIKKDLKGDVIFFKTKGDHNPTTYNFEEEIPSGNVIGKAVFTIPYVGWVKIGFTKLVNLFF